LDDEKKIPLSYVCLWVLLSILLISGTALMGWLYYLHVRNLRVNDDQYRIVAIIQNNSQNEALKTMYLAELLDLSFDQPVNIYQFDEVEGEKKLCFSPLIKKAEIKKIRPGSLYISYQTRTPMAYLGNYTNTAIDQEGNLFPFRPFFTPKALPSIYLGDFNEEINWGTSLKNNKEFQLALKIVDRLTPLFKQNVLVNRIDVSQAFSDSLGKCQIVIVLEEQQVHGQPPRLTYLRLNPDFYMQNLNNYTTLSLSEKNKNFLVRTIDFRIPHLAFIKTKK